MEFYKNIKIEKVSEDTYHLMIKVSDQVIHTVVLKPDQLEHIISQYRLVK